MSFWTGWTRAYVLYKLTFAQLIRYYEYGVELERERAMLIAPMFRPIPKQTPKKRKITADISRDETGAEELLRSNAAWVTVQ